MDNYFVIGLDIGTSSLKLVVLNSQTKQVKLELSKSTEESRINHENKKFNEQNVDVILRLVDEIFKEVPGEILKCVKTIQICGQMHGIVLWNKKKQIHSNLVTWQDARCDEDFLRNLPIKSISDLNSGYGCATLFWYCLNLGDTFLDAFDSAGTIQDYVAFTMSDSLCISPHNALSWGYFNLEENRWQYEDLNKYSKFPTHLLPDVKMTGFTISNMTKQFGASINVSLGDLQCSVYSCLENDTDCIINISTSSQVCFPLKKSEFMKIKSHLPKSITIFPYFDDKVLLVAASLNGGNVLDTFVESLLNWYTQLNMQSDEDKALSLKQRKDIIFERLITMSKCDEDNSSLQLKCKPTLYGERHNTREFGRIENLNFENIKSIENIFDSMCLGLIENLNEMFSCDLLKSLGCKRIVATGSCVMRNSAIKSSLMRVFGKCFPISFKMQNDAAYGAALFCTRQNILP